MSNGYVIIILHNIDPNISICKLSGRRKGLIYSEGGFISSLNVLLMVKCLYFIVNQFRTVTKKNGSPLCFIFLSQRERSFNLPGVSKGQDISKIQILNTSLLL